MSTKLEDKQEWFRSMYNCPNCYSEKYNYKLCDFHAEGKRLLGIDDGKQVDELVGAKMKIHKGALGGVLRYASGKEEEVSREYIHAQLGTKTFLKIVQADGQWVEL